MRLIDADELKTEFPTRDNSKWIQIALVRATINHMPTVEWAEEIVRWLDPDIDSELALEKIRGLVYGSEPFYRCDPDKNKECRKTGCYVNGGECKFTTVREYKMKGVEE